jgi:hypothetical protein
MDQHQVEWNEKVARTIIKNLEKRRMAGSYSAGAAQARDEILEMIPSGATVFRCGSMSAVGMGLWEAVAALPEVSLIDPYQPELSPEEGMELRRRGMIADVMIASTNAITLDGKLVNLDGMGNRVAAMAFGPKKVILVVGMNKVAPLYDPTGNTALVAATMMFEILCLLAEALQKSVGELILYNFCNK